MEARYRELGELLEEYRKAANLSQKELAEKVDGTSSSFLSQIEKGQKRPSREGLQGLINALNLGKRQELQLLLAARYDTPATEVLASNQAIMELAVTLDSMPSVRVRPEPIKTVLEKQVVELVQIWSSYTKAEQALQSRDWRKAQKVCEEVDKTLISLQRQTWAYLLDARGEAAYHQGEIREAARWYSQAALNAKTSQDNYIQAVTSIHLGDIDRSDCRWEQAQRHYKKAFVTFQTLSYPSGVAWAKRNEATVYLFQGIWDEAIDLLREAKQSLDTQVDESKMELAKTYYCLGWAKGLEGDWEASFEYRRKGLQLAQDLKDDHNMMLGYMYMADEYRLAREIDSAEKYYLKALELSEKTQEVFERGYIQLGLAKTYWRIGQARWQDAHKKYEETEDIYYKLGNGLRYATSLSYHGRLYLDEGNIGQARDRFVQAEEIFGTVNNALYQIQALVNLCDLSYQVQEWETLEDYSEKAQKLIETSPYRYKREKARLYSILAVAEIYKGEYEKAVRDYVEAFDAALHFNTFSVDRVEEKVLQVAIEKMKIAGIDKASWFCEMLVKSLEEREQAGKFSDLRRECQDRVKRLKRRLRELEEKIINRQFPVT